MTAVNLSKADTSYMGEGTTYPANAKNGAYMYRTDLKSFMMKVAGAWLQQRDAIVANATELNSIPTAVAGVGFKVYQQDINVLYMWNGSFWTIIGGQQPHIRLYRTSGTGYNNSNTYFVMPFDAVDAGQTFNPNNDWFDAKLTERRTQIKRPGLYKLHADVQTTVSTLQYLRFFVATAAVSTAGWNISQAQYSGISLLTLDGEWRFAAGEHVALMLISGGSDVADTRNTATGYAVHYMITRLSD